MRRISCTSKGDPTLEKLKADNAREIKNVRRWIDTNAEMKTECRNRRTVATQMTPKEQEEIYRGGVSVAVQTEDGQLRKGKRISPLEERRTINRKKPRQEELSYAEACGRNRQNAQSEDEWTVTDRTRGIRSVADKIDEEALRNKVGKEERRDIVARRRSEAILVKVG